MTDDYMSRLDDMLGEIELTPVMAKVVAETRTVPKGTSADSKSSIHPLWKLIDTWGGTMYLKARQLTLWGVEP